MGAAQSKQDEPTDFNEKWSIVKRTEEEDTLTRDLSELELCQGIDGLNSTGDLSNDSMKKWETELLKVRSNFRKKRPVVLSLA
jgi:hypothetical protein